MYNLECGTLPCAPVAYKSQEATRVSNGCRVGVACSCSSCHYHTLKHIVVTYALATYTPSGVAVPMKAC